MASQAQVQAPNKKCHNCRRQRLRCDRSYPHCNKCQLAGKECLGYGQLFRWTGAVASRGKLAGKTLSAPSSAPPSPACRDGYDEWSTPSDVSLSPVFPAPSESTEPEWVDAETEGMELVPAIKPTDPTLFTPWTLVDPLYQDLSRPYRYYLSYCKSRNLWSLDTLHKLTSLQSLPDYALTSLPTMCQSATLSVP